LLSSSKHSGIPEDSNPHFFQVLGFTPTLGQSRVATKEVNVRLHVGSDDLNLKKSMLRLMVQGFENLLTYDSMTFHVAIFF